MSWSLQSRQLIRFNSRDPATARHTDSTANPAPVDPNDHLERLIADGKLLVRPLTYHDTPKVVIVDLDLLCDNMHAKLVEIYGNHGGVRSQYSGSPDDITTAIKTDLAMLCDYAVAICYNRLRTVLEKVYPSARSELMNPQAPVHKSIEFPAWVSSTLSSIGPILTMDGPIEQYIVYSTVAERAVNYGRSVPHPYRDGPYARIMDALNACRIRMAPLDVENTNGSAFPTLVAAKNTDQTWNIIGTIHHSHYENEDLARIIFCLSDKGDSPFPAVGFTADYVDDKTTMNDLVNAPPPRDIPEGQTPESPGRPVAHLWDVNYFGIQLGVDATATVTARSRGCYIIGRGVERFFAHKRAQDISNTDCVMILHSRLLRTT